MAVACGLVFSSVGAWSAEPPTSPSAPDWQEVYGLLREHLPDSSPAELNRLAVQGLISSLSPRVSLVTSTPSTSATNQPALLIKSSQYDNGLVYVRIGRVDEGLASAVREGCTRALGTNKLRGIALDLRYAGGNNYPAAAAVADLFLSKDVPLLDAGTGMLHAKVKSDAIITPVTVLVNRQTSGAAEALAAILRQTSVALVLGAPTAGQAMLAQEYPLKNGDVLRIASAAIHLGDGAALTVKGVVPDISVAVNPADEQAYYNDTFRPATRTNVLATAGTGTTNGAATNRAPRRVRFNEAELVRERREGALLDADNASRRGEDSETPLVNDPVLARALDLLKGLAVVRPSHS